MKGITYYAWVLVLNAFALGSIVEWMRFDRPWAHTWGFWNVVLLLAGGLAVWQIVGAVQWFRRLGRAVDSAMAVLDTPGSGRER